MVRKGAERERQAYSAFDGTGLAETLRGRGIRRVIVGGLATDYCVRQTVLDAITAGFEVWLLLDAILAVDVVTGDRAVGEMRAAGARTLVLPAALGAEEARS